MSGRGGLRPGSGRKRIYSSKKECDRSWQRGHRRINLDNIVYSSWVSSKIKCGYSSDSEFARHLLSLEWRRRSVSTTVLFLNSMCFYANCFECRIISFNHNAFVLGRKTQSYRVRRERDRTRKTVLRPNADAILKVKFFVH